MQSCDMINMNILNNKTKCMPPSSPINLNNGNKKSCTGDDMNHEPEKEMQCMEDLEKSLERNLFMSSPPTSNESNSAPVLNYPGCNENNEISYTTFLRSVCDQVEFYFCDDNLLGDLFLLKNMNMEGYVKLELVASFGGVRKLTSDIKVVQQALELSTKLLLNETCTLVCRREPLPMHQTYHGKLARTSIAYNLPEDTSIASLKEKFGVCGEITYLRLLKKNAVTGRNAVLKPPIAYGETYAIIEFADDEMAKHAVLTLSDTYNWTTGMQVVLFDGTTSDKLKQKMFPVDIDRRRAKSLSAAPSRPVHVEAVGEGLQDLNEGKINTGTIYSIRGAGGLITPTRKENASISFRLVPDEDGHIDIKQGDYVSFTVGKNKKSGRKYASKVKLEFRPPSSITASEGEKKYFTPSANRWESRNRSSTAMETRNRSRTISTPPSVPLVNRKRISSIGSRQSADPWAPTASSGSQSTYRQAAGPDGTRGFASPTITSDEFALEFGRRRAVSSGTPTFPISLNGFGNLS